MLSDILEVNQAALAEMYDFSIQNDGNIIVFGSAGIGKTVIGKQVIDQNKLECCYVNLSVLEAPDFLGLINIENGWSSYAPPSFLPWKDKKDQPPTTLLLDEIDKAATELQAPLLELLQFRSINGRPLNIQGVLCTANLPDEQTFSQKLSHALTNRCSVFKVKQEFKPWRKWAIKDGLNPLVVSFLQSNQDLLLVKNSSTDPTAYCNPSPRSWALAAQDLDNLDYQKFAKTFSEKNKTIQDEVNSAEIQETIDEKFLNMQFRLVAGRVGIQAALKFRMWLAYYRKLSPLVDDILTTGHLDATITSDEQVVLATSLLAKMKEQILTLSGKEKKNLADRVFGWMVDNMSPAYMLAALKSSINDIFMRQHDLMESDKFNQLIDIIHEMDSQ